MNCRQFQDLMFEYLEGSVPPEGREAAEAHLTDCEACREAVRRQRQFGQFLSEGLRRLTDGLEICPDAHRRLMGALREDPPVQAGREGTVRWWQSLVWPVAVSAAIVVAAALMSGVPFGSRVPVARTARLEQHDVEPSLTIRLSYCAPIYTFHQEGNLVTDYVACDLRYVDETLRVYRK